MKNNKVVTFTGMNDYLFKAIFKNKRILIAYLKVFGVDAKEEEITYEDTEIKGEVKVKAVRFDIRIKNVKMRIDIEAQQRKIQGFNQEGLKIGYAEYQNHRKIHYASKLHSEAYQVGEKYFEGPKTKIIFFLDYDIEGTDYIQHTKYTNLSTKKVYEDVDIIEVSLPKIKEDDTIESRMFCVLREKNIEPYLKEDGTVGEVAKMIYEFNDVERAKLQKSLEEDNKRELEDMLYFAKNEGIMETRFQTAKKMLKKGFSIEDIMEITGLAKEKIERLK